MILHGICIKIFENMFHTWSLQRGIIKNIIIDFENRMGMYCDGNNNEKKHFTVQLRKKTSFVRCL